MCQRSLADLPRGKQWYQHIPEGSVSNLRFSLRTEASHTQARMPDPSWYCYEASLHLGSLGPPRARLESAATGQATDTGSQEDRRLQTRSRGKQRSGFYPFSPDAGKLGDTGGLNAAYTYVLIPVLLLDTGDRGLLEPEGPTAEGALDQMTTLSTHSLLPRDRARYTFWWQALSHPLSITGESAQRASRLFTLLLSSLESVTVVTSNTIPEFSLLL
ncbi:hypothetical protein MJG53_002258 [Ovis ammon polii x Ovis aries]|uniref:Uncharacterized protein n=1 Tax=Ovis ammon polii x Ovis aries TaxID=2918886 RepID=A0ACB9VNC1_9CETA|nr:hypothetical protein MJG53_002258 [Ovis ammon polii x Ovis aries]